MLIKKIIISFLYISGLFLLFSCQTSSGKSGKEKPEYHSSHEQNKQVTALLNGFYARKPHNEPDLGKKVLIFNPSMNMNVVQKILTALHKQQQYNQFGQERYALLFRPGVYDLRITVDYYMEAAGLGATPAAVVINGVVQSTTTTAKGNVTTMFWRSAANFQVNPTGTLYWAVSQAAPLRRMYIKGDLHLDKSGWASGGFLADSIITGKTGTYSGQQWFSRNTRFGSWYGGNWNITFTGCQNTPAQNWPDRPYTKIKATPVIREKPFLTVNQKGKYNIFIPDIQRFTKGVSWQREAPPGSLIPLSAFHIALPDKDNAASLNKALDSGQHLFFTPGIYKLDQPVVIKNKNTVIFGLGLPTLIPAQGKPALITADKGGIIISGIVADAGPVCSPVLIRIGPKNSSGRHEHNPLTMHDIFVRVGGPQPGRTKSAVIINSSDVIADHFWLWRADHGTGVGWQKNTCAHGLIVNGDNVTIYGLFNEHFQEYQTLWHGNNGRTYFYQSELPYDPPSPAKWRPDHNSKGYASYKVSDRVKTHKAYGLGIYSFFGVSSGRDYDIRADNAVAVPAAAGILIKHIAVFSAGFGGFDNIINQKGPSTKSGEVKWYDQFRPAPDPFSDRYPPY